MKNLTLVFSIFLVNYFYSQELNFTTYVNLSLGYNGNHITLSDNQKKALTSHLTNTKDSSKIRIGAPSKWNSSAPCKSCITTSDFQFIYFNVDTYEHVLYKNDTLTYLSESGKKDENNEYIYDNETGDLIIETKGQKDHLAAILENINSLEYWSYKNATLYKKNILTNLTYKKPIEYNRFVTRNMYSFISSKEPKKGKQFIKNYNYTIYFDNPDLNLNQATNYRNLTQAILNDIKQEKLAIISSINGKKIPPKAFFSYFIIDQIIPVRDENDELVYDELGDQIYDIENSYITLEDIIGISFEEDWYFDENQFSIIKEVKSATLILNMFDKLEGFKIETSMPYKIIFND